MNNITIFGRVTKEIELKTTNSNVAYARFNIASRSSIRGTDGEYGTNFFTCVAWRGCAERLHKFVKKGDALVIKGSLNSREYENNGTANTIWELNVEDFAFVGNKDNGERKELTPIDDDDIPF